MMETVVICDLDGTLLNDDGSVPVSFLSLVKTLESKNAILCFASSRSLQNIYKLFKEYFFDYYAICSDGSLTVHVRSGNIDVVDEANLSHGDVAKIIDELDSSFLSSYFLFTNYSNNFEIISVNSSHVINTIFNELISDGRQIVRFDTLNSLGNLISFNFVRSVSFFDLTDNIDNIAKQFKIDNILSTFKVYHYLETRFLGNMYAWLDIIPSNMSKGLALERLQCRNFNNKVIIALGNGTNDIELFEKSDFAFCPINSSPILSSIATHTFESLNGQEFIIEFINYFNINF